MRNAIKANAARLVFMALSLEDMRGKVSEIVGEIDTINALADKDDRDLTDDEIGTIDARKTEIDTLRRQISARETSEAVRAAALGGTGRKTAAEPQGNGSDRAKSYPSPRDPKAGFKSFGEFALCVKRGSMKEGADPAARERLHNAASSWGGENVGSDGGFAVPPEFRNEIAIKISGPDSLLSMTDKLTTSSNSITT